MTRHPLPLIGYILPLSNAHVQIVSLCHCQTGLPAVQNCPTENVWSIMKHKIQQWRPQTVEQLKQEWKRIPPTTHRQLVPSVPKRLLSVAKGKGM